MYRLHVIFVSDRLFEFDAARDLLIKDEKHGPYRYLTWRAYDQITPRGYLWSTVRDAGGGNFFFDLIGKQTEVFDGVGVSTWLESQRDGRALGVYHRSMFNKIVGQETESWPHLRQQIGKMQKFMQQECGKPEWATELEPLLNGQMLIDARHVAGNKFLSDLMQVRSAVPIKNSPSNN